jgi:hypothetical protein
MISLSSLGLDFLNKLCYNYIIIRIKEEFIMEPKIYVCPECGRKYSDLTKVQSCIVNHLADAKAKKDAERAEKAKREKEIETLQLQNAKLIEQVRENCRKLRGFGVNASVTYFENIGTKTTKVNIKGDPIPTCVKENVGNEEDALGKFLAELNELEKNLKAKMTPEEIKEAEDTEKLLKSIFGF